MSVTKSKTSSTNVSVSYDYSDDSKYLESITHGSTVYNLEYDEFSNRTDSKVGTQSLASYAYNSGNGALTSSTYGTGQTVSYTYDQFGNESTRYYNGTKAFTWHADRSGSIIREKDYLNNYQYDYTYDSTGRLVRKTAKDTSVAYNKNSLWYNLEYGYDLNNNITDFVINTPFRTMTNTYSYGQDNLLKTFNISKERTVSYVYDDLNRLKDLTISTTTPINIHYYYEDSSRSGYSTTKIYEEEIGDTVYRYEYDIVGNITKISEVLSDDSTTALYSYTYDKLNELTEAYDHTNRAKHSYTYNTNGNMLTEVITYYDSSSVPITSTTIRYAYSDTNWKDKLTNYNGQALTYDAIGNPLTYRDGMTMTWKNGRQLATFQDDENDITYNYDSNSVRISKNVNGVEYTYTYLNGMLVYETRGEAKSYYSYDSNGILYSIKYMLTDTSDTLTYYCTHNSRGDIIGIYNYQGTLRAKYEYDAWGNVLSVKDENGNEITSSTHIGNLNPFRYRGYYYDSETGLYYLMSRYYDPVTHRFLNADGYFQSGGNILDSNMSAYCRNNPINSYDPTGNTTWCEVQNLLVSGEATSFTINDVTTAQKMGYGPNDYVPFLSLKNTIPVGLGTIKPPSYKGWTWRIDTNEYSQKHIHIKKFAQKYAQNIDGSPHDGSTGSPPNSVKKYLKNNGIWDWDANEQSYNSSIKKIEFDQVYSDTGEIMYINKSLINPQGSANLFVMPMDTCFTGITVDMHPKS